MLIGTTTARATMPHFSACIDAMNAADALLEGSAGARTDEARCTMVAAATKLRGSVGSFQITGQMVTRDRTELVERCERFDQRLLAIARAMSLR